MLLVCLLFATTAEANPSWVGTSLYYIAGLHSDTQQYLFQNLQSAGVKVIRVWLDGQSGSPKGSTITPFPDLEPNQIGSYDDTVLNLMDTVMINAKSYGIKLMISMHSFNALGNPDVYGKKYGTGYFYEEAEATQAFDNRLRHILTHTNAKLGKQWKDLSDYIFAFEAENEAMIGKGSDYIAAHQGWQCDRAKTIRSVLGGSKIYVTTGGESWLDESMQPSWFTCDAIDIIAAHIYGVGDFDTNKIKNYVNKAVQNNKKMIVQEWGACYTTASNNQCNGGGVLNPTERGNNIKNWARQMSDAGTPWMYWQVIPNKDPHSGWDYEIGINDNNWQDFKDAALASSKASTPFNFTGYI